ncbi:hypothetical protein BX600DRAFT_472166 [Xylariales sp. PMI_506]|nr:hypothetical protein BX600DRAFT_472166 [Xylariales sp. PMI_506]
MSPDGQAARVRRAAKSCAECRRRKIRCTWPLPPPPASRGGLRVEERTACNRCVARGLNCLPQLRQARAPPSATANVTGASAETAARGGSARDRLGVLEQQMASLAALVRDRSGREGLQVSSSTSSEDPHQQTPPSLRHVVVQGGMENIGNELDGRGDIGDTNNPPSHLRFLFDDFDLLQLGDADNGAGVQRSIRTSDDYTRIARVNLQALLPSRDEIQSIAGFASDWMVLYHSLFPAYFTFRSGEQLVSSYDRMRHPEAHPVVLSMYLVSVAITTQQLGPEGVDPTFWRGHGESKFVSAVCRVVSRTVVENDTLLATVQGVEAAMLFIRLLLGRGNLKSTWVTLRRVIAVAEVIGLPRAHYEIEGKTGSTSNGHGTENSELEALKLKAAVWEAVCATDRNFGMMLNLPAGTSRYKFPLDPSIRKGGGVSAQAYNYQLSSISGLVFEIDELYMRAVPQDESYEKVLAADRQLRALAASAGSVWWRTEEGDPLADLMVKFWHCYITARVHLRPAMMRHSDDQYAYSRMTCLDACRNAVRRFLKFRSLTPSGFFVCRMLDVQAFTAATFLLFSSRLSGVTQEPPTLPLRRSWMIEPQVTDLIHGLVECFKQISDQPGSDFAREAVSAISTLESFIQGNSTGSSNNLTLNIPMLGRASIKVPEDYPTNDLHQGSNTNVEVGNSLQQASRTMTLTDNYGPDNRPLPYMTAPNTSLSAIPGIMSWNFEFENTSFWMPQDSSAAENMSMEGQQGMGNSMISWI